jgi:hypothetical protein
MTTNRPYRKAMPVSAALVELIDSSGTQFDPRVVETLVRVIGQPADHPATPAVEASGAPDDGRAPAVPPRNAPRDVPGGDRKRMEPPYAGPPDRARVGIAASTGSLSDRSARP